MRIIISDLPWVGKAYAGRAGMRWAHTSQKAPIISFRPFPFYLATTAALLEKHGHEVIVIDALAERIPAEEYFEKVEELKPDFLLAETHTPSYQNDVEIARELKKRVPSLKIMFAGPHATAIPEQVEKETKGVVEFILAGEYDFITLDAVEGRVPPGVVKPKEIEPIDKIPWPARHLFKMNLYNEVFCREYPNIQLMGSRGCPYRCSYCNIYQATNQRKQRCRDINDMVDEIEYVVNAYNPKELYYDDDIINGNPKWLESFCDLKIKRKANIPFTCMGHVLISTKLLDKMKEAGCQGSKFGIESADNTVLKKLGKGMTIEIAKRTIDHCKKIGIKTHLNFCIGLPGDTEESVIKTIEFAKNNGDHFQISIAAPLPGTPLWDQSKEEGWIEFKSWDEFDGMEDAIVNYPNLSAERLKEIAGSAQAFTYGRVLKTGEWKKYLRMIYDERGMKGLSKLLFIRGPGMAGELIASNLNFKKVKAAIEKARQEAKS